MDSDQNNSPEDNNISFFKRNYKLIGAIVVIALIVSSFYILVYSQNDGVDPEFAKKNAFLPELPLQQWYVSYLTDTRLYNFEVSRKISDYDYEIVGSDGNIYNLNIYEEVNEQGINQMYAKLYRESIESPPTPISIYFDIKSYIPTDPFLSIPETVKYSYLESIYLLFGAWDEAGIENQQLAYGMSSIAEAVGKAQGTTDHIIIEEITDEHYVKLYNGEIGTPTNPVIYLMTEPHGAYKNNIVVPYDGVIIIEMPNYEEIRLFSLLVGEFIAPTGGSEQ